MKDTKLRAALMAARLIKREPFEWNDNFFVVYNLEDRFKMLEKQITAITKYLKLEFVEETIDNPQITVKKISTKEVSCPSK